ncbi:hypothetical protein [Ruminobacter sp. RM87]|uniref:hypothetical protein n=1 Tax=Ruminobacter sp. RM87 TaxID=1200567 RepID=UPI0004E10C64|nr:hypothetical protein [Ruminobacter sp. RM87]
MHFSTLEYMLEFYKWEKEYVKELKQSFYRVAIPFSSANFNIRFKFKFQKELLRDEFFNRKFVFIKINNATSTLKPIKLHQYKTDLKINDQSESQFFSTLTGGIQFNNFKIIRSIHSGERSNIGDFAFYIKYTGNHNNVYVENTGNTFIVYDNELKYSFDFVDYPLLEQLYNALSQLDNFYLEHKIIENKKSSQLAPFSKTSLVNSVLLKKDKKSNEFYKIQDSAPLFVPFQIDNMFHQVEIIKYNNKIYTVIDGEQIVDATTPNDNYDLLLSDELGIDYTDFIINTNGLNDAEIVNDAVISSANPHILIFEGHGIKDCSLSTINSKDSNVNRYVNKDRLYYLFEYLTQKQYVPVSIKDVAFFYNCHDKKLPKRCFVPVFDDFRFEYCLNYNYRSIFSTFNVKPCLAIITDKQDDICFNSVTYNLDKAVTICNNNDFDLVSHTRNHRSLTMYTKPSEYMQELLEDIQSADNHMILSNILVFPFGHANTYLIDTLKWLGFKLGINVHRMGKNIKLREKYNLVRIDIGARTELEEILSKIL